MKRIAIVGTVCGERSVLTNALSAATGLRLIPCLPYSDVAARYKLDTDISDCYWPDSFEYCLGAFTQRIISEQKSGDSFISEGGVFDEITWLMCSFPHIELIYQKPIIKILEHIIVDYASKEYDFIFHVASADLSDLRSQCLKRLFICRNIKYYIIDTTDKEGALNKMLQCLGDVKK